MMPFAIDIHGDHPAMDAEVDENIQLIIQNAIRNLKNANQETSFVRIYDESGFAAENIEKISKMKEQILVGVREWVLVQMRDVRGGPITYDVDSDRRAEIRCREVKVEPEVGMEEPVESRHQEATSQTRGNLPSTSQERNKSETSVTTSAILLSPANSAEVSSVSESSVSLSVESVDQGRSAARPKKKSPVKRPSTSSWITSRKHKRKRTPKPKLTVAEKKQPEMVMPAVVETVKEPISPTKNVAKAQEAVTRSASGCRGLLDFNLPLVAESPSTTLENNVTTPSGPVAPSKPAKSSLLPSDKEQLPMARTGPIRRKNRFSDLQGSPDIADKPGSAHYVPDRVNPANSAGTAEPVDLFGLPPKLQIPASAGSEIHIVVPKKTRRPKAESSSKVASKSDAVDQQQHLSANPIPVQPPPAKRARISKPATKASTAVKKAQPENVILPEQCGKVGISRKSVSVPKKPAKKPQPAKKSGLAKKSSYRVIPVPFLTPPPEAASSQGLLPSCSNMMGGIFGDDDDE